MNPYDDYEDGALGLVVDMVSCSKPILTPAFDWSAGFAPSSHFVPAEETAFASLLLLCHTFLR